MRVLHLTPEAPFAPGGMGGATRQFHLLKRLAELGHDVTVVAPVTDEQRDRIGALRDAGVRVVTAARPQPRAAEAGRSVLRHPGLLAAAVTRPVYAWQVSVFWSYLRPLAIAAAREHPPDVVSVEHDYSVRWARDFGSVPAVLTCQNVSSSYYLSRARSASPPLRQVLDLESWRYKRFVRRHVGRYLTLIAMSAKDGADLRKLVSPKVEVIPNGVETDALSPPGSPDGGPPTLLFSGTINHPPNTEGILWFNDRIWPLITRRRPDVRLVIAGRDPPPAVQRLGRDANIEVTGTVPSMAPYLDRATAVIVPLLSGGGTRLKILDALAAQRGVVSTSVGAEGLEVESGVHLLLADHPEGFADATIELIEDLPLRESLAAQGRALVERRYDWRTLGDDFERVLLEAAGH